MLKDRYQGQQTRADESRDIPDDKKQYPNLYPDFTTWYDIVSTQTITVHNKYTELVKLSYRFSLDPYVGKSWFQIDSECISGY